jgi:hypothetical protein
MLTGICPLARGTYVQGIGGNSAVVQPQELLTELIMMALDEMLLKFNTKCAWESPA